jgi:hypothetical protein
LFRRGGHLGHLAHSTAQKALPDRGAHADLARLDVGFALGDQREGSFCSTANLLHPNGGMDVGLAGIELRGMSMMRALATTSSNLAMRASRKALVLLGCVVFRVLAQVAFVARIGDLLAQMCGRSTVRMWCSSSWSLRSPSSV